MKPVLKMPQPSRHPHPTVRACRLAHLIFERPDLELAERFLTDFGLVTALKTDDTLYLRGTGPDPYCYRVHRAPGAKFVGFGLCLPSETDLIKISQLPGASPIETCRDPGGGRRSRLTDPSGFLVEVVYGSSEARQCHAAPSCQALGDHQTRPYRARGRGIPEDVRVVYQDLRLHSQRRASSAGRLSIGDIYAPGPRRPTGGPPHDGHRAGLLAGLRPQRV